MPPHPPNFLEHLVDAVLELFNVRTSGNTTTHYVISLLILIIALLFRRILTGIVFAQLRRFAARTQTTLDDKLLPALEAPAATFVMVVGIFAALNVLKLSTDANRYVDYGSTVAFSIVVFWALWRAFDALLDHGQEIAIEKGLGIAAFMPWIKKTLVVLFVIIGVLLTAQSLGADVKAFLAGLGIGGLAFALAAQDTIANLFGSVVVALDQPFKIGEAVKIGAFEGVVEDIGLRSTRLRAPGKNLIIIPNKTVAAEAVTNNSPLHTAAPCRAGDQFDLRHHRRKNRGDRRRVPPTHPGGAGSRSGVGDGLFPRLQRIVAGLVGRLPFEGPGFPEAHGTPPADQPRHDACGGNA